MSQPKKLNALLSLRFFAAIIVVNLHAFYNFLPRLHIDVGGSIPYIIWQTVSFFFILSGFILTYIYPSLKNWNDIGRFFLARFARIWPLHIFSTICLYKIVPGIFRITDVSAGIANVFLIHSWIPIRSYVCSLNAPSWSLSTDCFFYLCFPLLLFSLKKRYWMTLAFSALFLSLYLYQANYSDISFDVLIYSNPLSRLFEFVLGMATALIFMNVNQSLKLSTFRATILELFAIFTIFIGVMGILYARDHEFTHWIGKAGVYYLILCGGLSLGLAFIIFALSLEQGIISKILSHKILVFLGEISFAIYLTHYNLMHFFAVKIIRHHPLNLLTLCVLYWISLLACATIIHYAIEVPCRRKIFSLWDKLKFKERSYA